MFAYVSEYEWIRYSELCGEIDIEIPVPELVQNGDLCPHMDFIHLSLPDPENLKLVREHHEKIEQWINQVRSDSELVEIALQHPWLTNPDENADAIFKETKRFVALLVFLKANGHEIPPKALELLDAKTQELPCLDREWMEALCQELLFGDCEYTGKASERIDALWKELRALGTLSRNRLQLTNPEKLNRAIVRSATKLDSIAKIAAFESANRAEALRLVVLTDFILSDTIQVSSPGYHSKPRVGVFPIFERLRQEGFSDVAVLTGSQIVFTADLEVDFRQLVSARMGKAYVSVGKPYLPDERFRLHETNDQTRSHAVHAITDLLQSGRIKTLVGTQSLLGEGWDAPAVNCLVVASNAGSFMLSNQIRGRAIRTEKANSAKTANIWHLATITGLRGDDPDLDIVNRRFATFVGPHLERKSLESGIARLGIPEHFTSLDAIETLNQKQFDRAADPAWVAEQWKSDVGKTAQFGPEMLKQTIVPRLKLQRYVWITVTVEALFWAAAFTFVATFTNASRQIVGNPDHARNLLIIALIVACLISLPKLFRAVRMWIKFGFTGPLVLQSAEALLEALIRSDKVDTNRRSFKIDHSQVVGDISVSLRGGTRMDKSRFANALSEMFGPVENPRYILLIRTKLLGLIETSRTYLCVPRILGDKKDNARQLSNLLNRSIRNVSLVYARNPEGRRLLLKARKDSLFAKLTRTRSTLTRWE